LLSHVSSAAVPTQPEVQKLLAPQETHALGRSVAINGNTAVIGDLGDDVLGTLPGSAYVFTRSGTTWSFEATLTAADVELGDFFGDSVAVFGDTALVGARGDSPNGTDAGSVYVFTRSGTTWTLQAKLTSSDGTADDQFGISVALVGDTALIGAWNDDGGGSAYVFTRTGNTWSQQAKVTASDRETDDCFGLSVALAGETALIGARGDDAFTGSAYVFTRSGTSWTQQAKLTANDRLTSDDFGNGVALRNDTALIGARTVGNRNGSAYVFTRSGTTWTQQAKLVASDGAVSDFFGSSVAIVGNMAVIGAQRNGVNGVRSGAAYVFTRSGTTWTEQVKLVSSDGADGDVFGYSAALGGGYAVIGAWGDNDATHISVGSAYVFALAADTEAPTINITTPAEGASYLLNAPVDALTSARTKSAVPGWTSARARLRTAKQLIRVRWARKRSRSTRLTWPATPAAPVFPTPSVTISRASSRR
jgi:hypothetical protein